MQASLFCPRCYGWLNWILSDTESSLLFQGLRCPACQFLVPAAPGATWQETELQAIKLGAIRYLGALRNLPGQ